MWLVVEMQTGPDTEDDTIYGTFPAKVVARMWIEKKKDRDQEEAKRSGRLELLARYPKIYTVVPLFEPYWPTD